MEHADGGAQVTAASQWTTLGIYGRWGDNSGSADVKVTGPSSVPTQTAGAQRRLVLTPINVSPSKRPRNLLGVSRLMLLRQRAGGVGRVYTMIGTTS
jgi:hypothetical protein